MVPIRNEPGLSRIICSLVELINKSRAITWFDCIILLLFMIVKLHAFVSFLIVLLSLILYSEVHKMCGDSFLYQFETLSNVNN